jgi:iron(III) transport system substrate-binding protein
MRSARVAWLVLASAAAVAACGSGGSGSKGKCETPAAGSASGQALVTAAKCEGSVLVYGSPNDAALKADVTAFTKKYGIKANYLRLNAGPLTTRVEQEVKGGKVEADVVITADEASMKTWSTDGTLSKLPTPSRLRFTDASGTIQQLGQGLYYNSKKVSQADVPKTWGDLLNPRWKGQLVMGSPRVSPSYAELYLGILKDPKYGQAWFQKLAAQKPRIVDTDPQVSQSVNTGETELGMVGLPQNVTSIKATDPSAALAFTTLDVITVSRSDVGVLAKAPHPNAGRLFAEWLMTKEGQTVHNGDQRSASPLGPTDGALAMPPANQLSPLTSVDVSSQINDLIDMFDRLYK